MNKKYDIKKDNEERIIDALEAIADTLASLREHIGSDPGDEVEHITRPKKGNIYDHSEMD